MPPAKKNRFDDLDSEFKANIENMSDDEIQKRVAEVALDNAELMQAKKDDQDLAEKKNAVKEASAVYREGAKANKLKIEYAQFILESRGKR